MNLYYTTSAGENQEQYIPQFSLGGYKSSSPVKSDDYENLFSEISLNTLNQDRPHHIAIMLVNESGKDAKNLKIWVETPAESYSKFEIAAVDPALVNGVLKIERTRDIFSKPYYASFSEHTIDSKGDLGDLDDTGYIGLWIRRVIDMIKVEEDENSLIIPDPARPRMYKEVELSKSDTLNIQISWEVI